MHFLNINFTNIFHSAILKLTLFYVLVAMAISISFSVAIFNISSQELNRGLGRQTRVLRDAPMGGISITLVPSLEQIRLDQLDESNDRLRLNLIYFNLLILLLSSGISYFLARRTLRPIEESMEAQNRFTADASHELRTPLTAMRTEIEVILRGNKLELPAAKKLLESNLEEIEKLESLSNALLVLSRYQGEPKKSFTNVSLEEILVEAYEKVESMANKKSINIKCHPELGSGSGHIEINGDKQSLIELFVILLDNAVKYSPADSKIIIDIAKEHNHVIIRIKDHGLGIKASDLPHIFDRFYRADSSRSKEKIDGYGLGLSIAKRIVELHDGTISVTSKPDKGSEFTVKL